MNTAQGLPTREERASDGHAAIADALAAKFDAHYAVSPAEEIKMSPIWLKKKKGKLGGINIMTKHGTKFFGHV